MAGGGEHEEPATEAANGIDVEDEIPFEDDSIDTDEISDETSNPLQQVIFDTIFAMVYKNETIPPAVDMLFMLFEDLQFLTYTFQGEFGNDIPEAAKTALDALKFVINSWNTYIIYLAVAIVTVWAVFINIIYTARSIKDSSGAVWPLRTLRLAAAALMTILYIPYLEVFFFGLSCDSNGALFLLPHDAEFRPSCFSSIQAPLSALSLLTLIFYVPLVHGLSLVYLEADPSSNYPSARSHGRVECFYLATRTIVVIVNTVGRSSVEARLFVQLFAYSVLFFAFARYQPFYNTNLNNVRCGSLFAGVLVSIFSMNTYFLFQLQSSVTIPLSCVLIVVGAGIGFWGSIQFRKFAVKGALRRMNEREEEQQYIEQHTLSQIGSGELPEEVSEMIKNYTTDYTSQSAHAVAPHFSPLRNNIFEEELRVKETEQSHSLLQQDEITPSPIQLEGAVMHVGYSFPPRSTGSLSQPTIESGTSNSSSMSESNEDKDEEKHALYGRFANHEKVFSRWTDSEILVRDYLTEVRAKKRIMNADDFMTIYKIFLTAFDDCPNSTGPHVQFVLYLRAFYSDSPLVQMHVKKAEELPAPLDMKFSVYLQKRLLQQQKQRSDMGSNTEIKVVNLFEHNKYWKLASKYHRLAATQIVAAWKYVLECGGDVRNLPNYARKISDAIERATSAYDVLLERFPNDKTAMDSYIDFSFDIKNDTKKGNALMLQLRAASEIKKTDDDLESKSSAHGYSAKDLAEYKPPESFSRERRASIASGVPPSFMMNSFPMQNGGGSSSTSLPMRQGKNGRNKMNSRQLLARQAEATEKEDEKFKELQLKLTRQFDALQRKSLKSLIVSLWMTTLGLIILLSANLAMMQTVNLSWLAQYRWEQTSQGLRFYLNRIYLDVRRQAIAEAKLYDMQDPVAHALRWADTLTFDADRAVDGMNDVYELSDASSKAAIWNAVSITMHDKTSLSLFAAISTYGRHGAALGSLGKARKYPIQNYQNHTSFRFVLDNGLRISWAMKEAVEKERESRQKSLDGPSIGTSVLLGISLGLQYLLVGKVVIPKLQRFHAQQMRITLIFTKIPKARIKEIVQKMQAINDSLASLLDHKRRVGEKGQKVEKVTEQNTEQEGAGGLGRTNTIAKKEEKEKPRAETGTDENTIKTGKENVNDVASQVQLLFWILAACLTITDAMLLLLLLLHFDPQYGSRLSSTIAITDFRAELVLENALAFEHILADKTSWAVPEDLRKTFITQHHHTLSDAWVALLKSSTPVVMNAAWLEDRKSADYISMNTWVADVPPIVGSWSSWIPASTIKNDMPYNRNNPRALPLADENRYTGSLSLFEATCLQAKDRLRNDSFLSSACVNSSLGIPRHGGYRPILLNSGLSVTSFSSLPHLITEVMFSYEWFTEAQPGSIGTPVPYFDFADTVTPALVYSGLPNWQKVASDEFLGSLNVASFSYAIISGASIVIVILVHVLAQRSFSGLMAQTVQVCEMFKMIPAKALEAVTDLSQFAEELANMEFKKTNTVFEYLRNFFMRMWQTTKLEMDDVQDEEKNLTLKIENGLRLSKTSQLKEEEDGEKRNVGKQNNVGVSRRQTKLKGIVKTMTLSEEEGEVSSLDPLDTPVQPPTGLAEKEAGPVSFSLNRGTRKSSMRMAVTVESDADISVDDEASSKKPSHQSLVSNNVEETGVTPFRPRMRTLSLRRGSHQSDVPVQSVAWKSNELAEVEGHGSLDA